MAHQVRAVVSRSVKQPVEVVTINVPDPGPGEALVRPQARRIYVGKERSRHTVQQEDINTLLVRLARECDCVVRL